MYKKFVGSAVLLGILFLVGSLAWPAYGASKCAEDLAGTQAYAECFTREQRQGAIDAAPGASEPPTVREVVESTAVWQLALVGGAGIALGVAAALGGRAAVQHRHAHATP